MPGRIKSRPPLPPGPHPWKRSRVPLHTTARADGFEPDHVRGPFVQGATPVVWEILRDPEVPGRWTFSECCGVPPGGPEWGYDDLLAKAKFNDCQLHVEFNLMGVPATRRPRAIATAASTNATVTN